MASLTATHRIGDIPPPDDIPPPSEPTREDAGLAGIP